MQTVIEILVYSQTSTKRVYVGRLYKEKGLFLFEYSKTYQSSKKALALGPEFPLWKSRISSKKLFLSLQDRIPSRQNPAYRDYCKQWGIDENENDEFILLTTIGKRGPSTFIFEPKQETNYTGDDLKKFRHRLGLCQSEFESLFGVSHLTLVRLENSTSENPVYLRYFEIMNQVPQALQWLLERRGVNLHDEKKKNILKAIDI